MSFKTRFTITQQNVCRQAVPDVWCRVGEGTQVVTLAFYLTDVSCFW